MSRTSNTQRALFRLQKALNDPPPVPSLSEMTKTGTTSGGMTFRPKNAHLIPEGSAPTPENPRAGFASGIYEANGQTRYVKGAMRHPEGDFAHTPSEPIRQEHAVHQLYGFFANDRNGIGKVDAALHTGPNGAVAQPGHQWKPNDFAWMSTGALTGAKEMAHLDPRTAGLLGTPETADAGAHQNALRTMKNGAVVDSVLNPEDMYGMNYMATPTGDKVYRIDTGGHLGLPSAFVKKGETPITDGFHDTSNDHLAISPELAKMYHGISNGFNQDQNWGMSGLHGDLPADHPERDAYWKDVGQSAIEQAKDMLAKYDGDQEGFAAALQHVGEKEYIKDRIDKRMNILRRMIENYESNPEELGRRMRAFGETKDKAALEVPMRRSLEKLQWATNIDTIEILKKGQLRTQTPKALLRAPNIRSVLARPATDDDTEGVFTYQGKRYVMTPAGRAIHADQTHGRYRIPNDDDEYGYGGDDYDDFDNEEEDSGEMQLPVHGRPPVVIPHSLRDWLRSQGFHSSYYDKVVDDNHAAHALDSSPESMEETAKKTHRRPAFFFAPGVYDKLMKHLNETGEVFTGDFPSRIPLEQQAYLIGTKHVDPESGIPWVVINDHIANGWDHDRSTTHSASMDDVALNGYSGYFKRYPERYIAGHAHSHPPGGEALPSMGDIGLLSDQFVRRAPVGAQDYYATQHNPDALFMLHSPGAFHTHRGVLLHGPQAGRYIERFGRQVGPNEYFGDGENPDTVGRPYGSGGSDLTIGYRLPKMRQIGANGSVTNFFHFGPYGNIVPATHGFFGARPIGHAHQVTVVSPQGGPQMLANATLRTQYPIDMFPGRLSTRARLDGILGEDPQGTNAHGRKLTRPIPVSWARHLNGEDDALAIGEPTGKSFRRLRRALQKARRFKLSSVNDESRGPDFRTELNGRPFSTTFEQETSRPEYAGFFNQHHRDIPMLATDIDDPNYLGTLHPKDQEDFDKYATILRQNAIASGESPEQRIKELLQQYMSYRANTEPDFVHHGKRWVLHTDKGAPGQQGWKVARGRARDLSNGRSAPATILPYSLRKFLSRNGYARDYYGQVVNDNASMHEADIDEHERATGTRPSAESVYRRPVYFFHPGVHEAMHKFLESHSQKFEDGGDRTPAEAGGKLLGVMNIDPESGTPWIEVTHFLPWATPKDEMFYNLTQNKYENPDQRKLLEDFPHLTIVGQVHSHPPGSRSYPSAGDVLSLGGNGPHYLSVIHNPNTIRVGRRERRILARREARAKRSVRKLVGSDAHEFLSGDELGSYLDERGLSRQAMIAPDGKTWIKDKDGKYIPIIYPYEKKRAIAGGGDLSPGQRRQLQNPYRAGFSVPYYVSPFEGTTTTFWNGSPYRYGPDGPWNSGNVDLRDPTDDSANAASAVPRFRPADSFVNALGRFSASGNIQYMSPNGGPATPPNSLGIPSMDEQRVLSYHQAKDHPLKSGSTERVIPPSTVMAPEESAYGGIPGSAQDVESARRAAQLGASSSDSTSPFGARNLDRAERPKIDVAWERRAGQRPSTVHVREFDYPSAKSLYKLQKAVGQEERQANADETAYHLVDVEHKPRGIFHKIEAAQYRVPQYTAKFGDDGQMVMHISPDRWEQDEHEEGGPPPKTYSIDWFGAMPGSTSSTMDPAIKKEIFNALYNHGVRSFTYTPRGGIGHGQRQRLFDRLKDEYISSAEWRDENERQWGSRAKSLRRLQHALQKARRFKLSSVNDESRGPDFRTELNGRPFSTTFEQERLRPEYTGLSRGPSSPRFAFDMDQPGFDSKRPIDPDLAAAAIEAGLDPAMFAPEGGQEIEHDFVHHGKRWLLHKDILTDGENHGIAKQIAGITNHRARSFPATILPYSLRQFLSRNGYSRDYYGQIVNDNAAGHEADIDEQERATGTRPSAESVYRRPVYFFHPGVHEAMHKFLESHAQKFEDGGDRSPVEAGGHLLGVMNIDPESGTPYVEVTHFMPYGTSDNKKFSNLTFPDPNPETEELLAQHPHLALVGDVHAHPPGGRSLQSAGDIAGSSGMGPHYLQIVHSPNTLRIGRNERKILARRLDRDKTKNFLAIEGSSGHDFLSGEEADAYLHERALDRQVMLDENGQPVTNSAGEPISITYPYGKQRAIAGGEPLSRKERRQLQNKYLWQRDRNFSHLFYGSPFEGTTTTFWNGSPYSSTNFNSGQADVRDTRDYAEHTASAAPRLRPVGSFVNPLGRFDIGGNIQYMSLHGGPATPPNYLGVPTMSDERAATYHEVTNGPAVSGGTTTRVIPPETVLAPEESSYGDDDIGMRGQAAAAAHALRPRGTPDAWASTASRIEDTFRPEIDVSRQRQLGNEPAIVSRRFIRPEGFPDRTDTPPARPAPPRKEDQTVEDILDARARPKTPATPTSGWQTMHPRLERSMTPFPFAIYPNEAGLQKAKTPAWQRKEGQNPHGGLNAKGRASAKREGHNLKPPVKSGDNPRRASFLARMGGSPGPEHDEHGKPTRLLLALQAWGASSKADAKAKARAMSARLKNKKDS